MTDTRCVICDRPMPDQAYACERCGVTKPTEQLATIADMTPAARDIAHGLSRRAGGGSSGKPGSRLPLDLGATSKLDAVQAALTLAVDRTATIRGLTRPWFTHHGDPITAAAQFLLGHGNLEWARHRPDVDKLLTDIAAAARVVAGIARGPAAQRYLGPCGAQQWTKPGAETQASQVEGWYCDGDVYAREGSPIGRCRTCEAEVSTDERRAWLDGEVRAHAFRATDIGKAYGVNTNTIRSWAARGQLVEHGRDRDDKPLYNVGDVLDLAAADAARRAEQQAKRARRKENAA
jgi:hypothetical protein